MPKGRSHVPEKRGDSSPSERNERYRADFNPPELGPYYHDDRNLIIRHGDEYPSTQWEQYYSWGEPSSGRQAWNGHISGPDSRHEGGYYGREVYGRDEWRSNNGSGYYGDDHYQGRGHDQGGRCGIDEYQRRGYHSYPSTRRGSPSRQPFSGQDRRDDQADVPTRDERRDVEWHYRGDRRSTRSHQGDYGSSRYQPEDRYPYDGPSNYQNRQRDDIRPRNDHGYNDDNNHHSKKNYIPPRARKAHAANVARDQSMPSYPSNAHTSHRIDPHHDDPNYHFPRQDMPTRSSPPPSFPKSKRKGEFVPTLPPAEYLALSDPRHLAKSSAGRGQGRLGKKLLVLDLNGALLYRTRGTERSVYPRPYLGNFLEYLFTPDSTLTSAGSAPSSRFVYDSNTSGVNQIRAVDDGRGYEVHVWSSAQPHNVRTMVETSFGPRWIPGVYEPEDEEHKTQRLSRGDGRLLGVWARDMMNLNSQDYGQNVQTFKDLRKIIDHIAQTPSTADHPPLKFDEKSVILLDDSPLKAVNQPWNQIVLPEFDKTEYHQAKALFPFKDMDRDPKDMDQALLAVIGILDTLRGVENVPAWVRAGGLNSPLCDVESLINQRATEDGMEVSLEQLPSHQSFAHWFANDEILRGWIMKGKEVLARRGIEIDPGIDQDGRRKRTGKSPKPKNKTQLKPRTPEPASGISMLG